MDAIETITNSLSNAPLYVMIERMGIAVANAQKELDRNSIELLKDMSQIKVKMGGDDSYNLIELGFTPTFYAFTEATFDAKIQFSLTETESFSLGASLGVNIEMVSVSVNASYARKFEQSAEGSSALSVKLISLPPPENFMNLLKKNQ
jgi:hypothetical protein